MYTYLLKLWLPDMRDSCGGWNGRCRQLKALFIHSPSLSTTCLFLRSMLIESPLHAGLDLGVESKKCQECLPGSSLSEWWMEGTISWDEKAKKRAWLGEWYQQFSTGDADSETSSRYPHVAKLAAHWPVGIARRWWGGRWGMGNLHTLDETLISSQQAFNVKLVDWMREWMNDILHILTFKRKISLRYNQQGAREILQRVWI